MTARVLHPRPCPLAALPSAARDEVPHGARGELTPLDADTGVGFAHDVRGKPHAAPAHGAGILENDLHRSTRRPAALRAHESPARADVLEGACDRRQRAAGELHGQTDCDALAPAMLHDRSPTEVVSSHYALVAAPGKSFPTHRRGNLQPRLSRTLKPRVGRRQADPARDSHGPCRRVPPAARRCGPR